MLASHASALSQMQRVSPTKSATQAPALLRGTDAQAVERWQKLDVQDLDKEIAEYRESVAQLTNVLKGLGVEVSADEEKEQDASKAAHPGAEVGQRAFDDLCEGAGTARPRKHSILASHPAPLQRSATFTTLLALRTQHLMMGLQTASRPAPEHSPILLEVMISAGQSLSPEPIMATLCRARKMLTTLWDLLTIWIPVSGRCRRTAYPSMPMSPHMTGAHWQLQRNLTSS